MSRSAHLSSDESVGCREELRFLPFDLLLIQLERVDLLLNNIQSNLFLEETILFFLHVGAGLVPNDTSCLCDSFEVSSCCLLVSRLEENLPLFSERHLNEFCITQVRLFVCVWLHFFLPPCKQLLQLILCSWFCIILKRLCLSRPCFIEL